jgi:hypothetical protein
MSLGPKRISDLPIATTAASSDRLLFLQNAAGTANTVTITLQNFANAILQTSLPYANSTVAGAVKTGNNVTVNATGFLSAVPTGSTTQVQFNNSGVFGGVATFTYTTASDTVAANNLTANVVSTTSYILANAGFQSVNTYAGSYADGLVMDYVNGMGRISVGQADSLTIYGNGIANISLLTVNSTSGVSANTFVGNVVAISVNATSAVIASSNVVINSSGLAVANATGGISVGATGGTANAFLANTSTITVGNSSVNTFMNTSHFYSGNSTIYGVGNNTAESLVSVNFYGAGQYTQTYVTAANVFVGNTTNYGFGNSTVELLYTATAQTVMTATTMSVGGNTTAQTYINSTAVLVGNSTAGLVNTYQATVVSNTLTLGTSTSAANGYTYLPNGLKMNWGWVSSNSSVGAVTFTSAYTTNAYVVTATSNSTVATYGAAVTAWTKTGATVLTANVTATNVFWTAIGT